ncbi:inositol monophosphatase family protein [Peribacillus loiseleuriae]|uniref:inositol monophosphatase family protein n=1 Tax=Peribacillus loiseleuriae TaxID=1679170 RepID=UPI001FE0663D|nr:inositol monophosphatase family protein [Peribacillus loiseleuriae]
MVTEKKSSSFDVVTEIDKRSERMIRSCILESARDIPYLWIVDPIGGTANFIHSIPGFTVSIAWVYQGKLVLGVIYDLLAEMNCFGQSEARGRIAMAIQFQSQQ